MHASPPARAPLRLFAWLGALLFAGSLAYCAYTYTIVMGRPAPPDATLWPDAALNAALFLAFALHHSVFARERVRAAVSRIAAPGSERSVYVWVASLLLIAVCWWWQPLPGDLWRAKGPLAWVLTGVQIGGVWLTLRSAAAIDALDLAGVKQVEGADGAGKAGEARRASGASETDPTRPTCPTQPPVLEARGPYAWVRHPIYAGWFLMVFGAPAMTASRLLFALLSCLYLLAAIPLEEASLRATTGGAYERYVREVRWKLIPGVY